MVFFKIRLIPADLDRALLTQFSDFRYFLEQDNITLLKFYSLGFSNWSLSGTAFKHQIWKEDDAWGIPCGISRASQRSWDLFWHLGAKLGKVCCQESSEKCHTKKTNASQRPVSKAYGWNVKRLLSRQWTKTSGCVRNWRSTVRLPARVRDLLLTSHTIHLIPCFAGLLIF